MRRPACSRQKSTSSRPVSYGFRLTLVPLFAGAALLLLGSLFTLSAAEPQHGFSFRFEQPYATKVLPDTGKPLRTVGILVSGIDYETASRVLLTDTCYSLWVIPGLNARDGLLHDPMAVYTLIRTAETGNELTLLFDLHAPLRIDAIEIPFHLSTGCPAASGSGDTVIDVRLKHRNLAVRDAVLRLTASAHPEGTRFTTDLLIDFTFIVDLLLDRTRYAENMEQRLLLCTENFFALVARLEREAAVAEADRLSGSR